MRWLLRETSVVVLIFGFLIFSLASRQFPVMEGLEWPKIGDLTMLAAGLCAYAAGGLAQIKL